MVTQKYYYQATAQGADKQEIRYSGIVYAVSQRQARGKLKAACKEISAKLKDANFSIYPPEGRKKESA